MAVKKGSSRKVLLFSALMWMRHAHVFTKIRIKAESEDAANERAQSLADSYNAKFVELKKAAWS